MQRTGTANLPLHPGKAPPWLFKRMVKLSGAIVEYIADEYGSGEVIRRISDPVWFQSFGNVLGFDFHSSGLTTVTCGALKESLKKRDIGISVAGGKGKYSRMTVEDIKNTPFDIDKEKMMYSSKMSAKVDSGMLMDNYDLYHHSFIFDTEENWCVIQQGLNPENSYARRYHWLSDSLKNFVEEPHSSVDGAFTEKIVMDMTSRQSRESRKVSLDIVKDNPKHFFVLKGGQTFLDNFGVRNLDMGRDHYRMEISQQSFNALMNAYEYSPGDFQELIGMKGIGKASIRALALTAEVIYGAAPSKVDPVKYSFAHGGKDGIPYPVDRKQYDKTIELIEEAINDAKLDNDSKKKAIKRLSKLWEYTMVGG